MRRREFIGLVACSAALMWPFRARARQAEKRYRVGFLGTTLASAVQIGLQRAFAEQLEKNGFREG